MITQQRLHELFYYQDGNLVRKAIYQGNRKIGTYAGALRKDGYIKVGIDDKQYLLHRLIFLYHHGHLPQFLDHADGNKSNNKIENLRAASRSQNNHNQKVKITSKTKLKGVCYHPQRKKWQARIHLNKKKISLGYFLTAEEAHEQYKKAAVKYFGEFARFF